MNSSSFRIPEYPDISELCNSELPNDIDNGKSVITLDELTIRSSSKPGPSKPYNLTSEDIFVIRKNWIVSVRGHFLYSPLFSDNLKCISMCRFTLMLGFVSKGFRVDVTSQLFPAFTPQLFALLQVYLWVFTKTLGFG